MHNFVNDGHNILEYNDYSVFNYLQCAILLKCIAFTPADSRNLIYLEP